MTIVNASRGTSKKYVDDKVADAVAAEAQLRQTADGLIQEDITRIDGLITAETSARSSADDTLQDNIDNVSSNMVSEIGRVDGRITDNATAISNEQSRAETAEQALNALIGDTNSYGTVTQAVLDDAKDYTDEQITQRVTQVYSVQGSCTYSELQSKPQVTGNVWNVTDGYGTIGDNDYVPPGTNYVWTGTTWDAMGGSIDLSAYELTSSVNTKLTEYSKTTAINSVLAQHQNLIKRTQVTVRANDTTVSGKTYTVSGVTGANTEILIVSPEPSSIQDAVDYGLYASASGSGTITFTSDIAPASNVTFDVTIISTATGTQIS